MSLRQPCAATAIRVSLLQNTIETADLSAQRLSSISFTGTNPTSTVLSPFPVSLTSPLNSINSVIQSTLLNDPNTFFDPLNKMNYLMLGPNGASEDNQIHQPRPFKRKHLHWHMHLLFFLHKICTLHMPILSIFIALCATLPNYKSTNHLWLMNLTSHTSMMTGVSPMVVEAVAVWKMLKSPCKILWSMNLGYVVCDKVGTDSI